MLAQYDDPAFGSSFYVERCWRNVVSTVYVKQIYGIIITNKEKKCLEDLF